ncbi:hypothetical protein QM996_00250 [Sinorhizobium chiapasense]
MVTLIRVKGPKIKMNEAGAPCRSARPEYRKRLIAGRCAIFNARRYSAAPIARLKRVAIFQIRRFKPLIFRMSLSQNRYALLRDML